jgi:hypothetical protein
MAESEPMTSDFSLANLTSKKGWVRVKPDPRIWLPIPAQIPEGLDYDEETWAPAIAEAWWELSGLKYSPAAVQRLAVMLRAVREQGFEMVPCHQVWAWYRDIDLPPLPLHIGIWQMTGEREQQLSALSGATDLDVIRAPEISTFTTESLGTGFRTLRRKQTPEGTVVVMLGFAFRSEELETDIQITTGTPDLKQLARATPDIESFVHQVDVYYHPATS